MYYRYHIKKGLVLGKGLKIRYQTFIKKRNQSQKLKEKKRKEINLFLKKRRRMKKKEEDDSSL